MTDDTPELDSLAKRVRANRAALRDVRAESDADRSSIPRPASRPNGVNEPPVKDAAEREPGTAE